MPSRTQIFAGHLTGRIHEPLIARDLFYRKIESNCLPFFAEFDSKRQSDVTQTHYRDDTHISP